MNTVSINAAAAKQIRKLEADVRDAVMDAIGDLRSDARPAGCKKLKGASATWRVRVRDWRIVYTIRGAAITVTRVAHRREVYD